MYCDYLEYSSEENGTGSDTDGAGQTRVLDYREGTEYTAAASGNFSGRAEEYVLLYKNVVCHPSALFCCGADSSP